MNYHYPFSISNHFRCRLVRIYDNMFMSEFIGYGHAIGWIIFSTTTKNNCFYYQPPIMPHVDYWDELLEQTGNHAGLYSNW